MKEGLRLAELGEIPFDEKEILRYAMLPSFAPAPEELPMKESMDATIAESSRLMESKDGWMLVNGQVSMDELLAEDEGK